MPRPLGPFSRATRNPRRHARGQTRRAAGARFCSPWATPCKQLLHWQEGSTSPRGYHPHLSMSCGVVARQSADRRLAEARTHVPAGGPRAGRLRVRCPVLVRRRKQRRSRSACRMRLPSRSTILIGRSRQRGGHRGHARRHERTLWLLAIRRLTHRPSLQAS